MKQINLNGRWELYFSPEEGHMPSCIEDVISAGWKKIDANVPGNVELDLQTAGMEGDPFVGMNLYDYRKYEYYQWWFVRRFHIPHDFPGEDKRAILKLKGVDTFSTIWVNGKQVLETDNMLVEHCADVSGAVVPGGENTIVVRISSAMNVARRREYPINVKGGEYIDEMLWIRKPPSSFGWDIAPRILSAGIWRDIELLAESSTHINEVYYTTLNVGGNTAKILVKFRFETDDTYMEGFSVRVKGECKDSAFEKEYRTGFCSGQIELDLQNPKLWWPKGYGEANLYEMTFELLQHGIVLDTRRERIGIRKIIIEKDYPETGKGKFRIFVNGVPVMVKGTNWVPLDALHSRDKSRLREAHDMLADLKCNMVRCWGGNVYEDHDFFDLCDERGVMVWQDFSLACAIYPQNAEFAGIMEKEASSVVKKLRNHPSLALWCGDNEVDQIYYHYGYSLPHARYNRITRETLFGVVGTHDPFREYIPSSPYIPENLEGDLNVPEQHNWGPRDYFKSDFYKHTSAAFISEIGYHGCPSVSSMKKFISAEKLWSYGNDEWDTHNTDYILYKKRHYNRNELMAKQIRNLFGIIPENMEDFVFASQVSQAEAKKFFIEMVRLKKWDRTGLIWWNLLDCWPQISDAVVDYYFVKKIAYYYIKRVQEPVCLVMSELTDWAHKVVLCNDGYIDAEVCFEVEDADSGNVVLAGTCFSRANEDLEIGGIKGSTSDHKLYLLKWKIKDKEFANHYVSGFPPFDLNRYMQWMKKIEKLPESFASEASYL